MAEKLIGADPGWFVRYILAHQSGSGFPFPEASVADYVACAQQPGAAHAWCADYRAGWREDRALDEADRGRKLSMPLLVLWGESGSLKGKDGVALWRSWAVDVTGEMLRCGHFIPEEQPAAVAEHFLRFFAA